CVSYLNFNKFKLSRTAPKLFDYFENEKKLSIKKSPYTKGGFRISNKDTTIYLGVETPLDNYSILNIINNLKKLKLDYGTLLNHSKRDGSRITKYEDILDPQLYNPHCNK
ncbi:hypothetical protein, partial [uncultured Brachyspira sp.]|uniref:hypothetical protein n=1 Tax=uncultured Brachyspira sp. TaxID=221953 RepID=UPI002616AD03